MRSLSPEQFELIVAAANEGLSLFSAGGLEKDVHLTEVLRALKLVETEDLTLVFCGGTSLVKAYGYLNRMSEDIDIKIVDRSGRSTSAIRQSMSHLKVAVTHAFVDAGFAVDASQAMSANRYITFDLRYEPKFPSEVSLRPEIKVEFTYAPAHLPVVQRSISTLLLRDLGMTEQSLKFACNAMEETLAEKVLGFLRRSSKLSSKQDGDERLVRHIHDVHILAGMAPDLVATHRAFKLAVEEDVRKFANQDPAFSQNPKLMLQTALQKASTDSQRRVSYSKFVEDLVAGGAPDFDAALSTFALLAGGLIAELD
ncbi:MAG TPA: nucleotidyl transferase AbiEii/AbiGii toxin family protein [Candidatus Paceibacterota bacterium]|nr:nucleotidyl transferase AbiEii/AbiGii toxin family protein [Candidatus Paceibacterota bacterium]